MFRTLPLLLLTGCVRIFVSDDAVTFADPVERLVADLHAGSVEVIGADVTETTVERHAEFTEGAEPIVRADYADGVLTLSVECPDKAFVGTCFVDHRVLLPSAVAAELETGSGDIVVTNLDGSLTAVTGSGDVAVTDVAGAVSVQTGSGDVALEGALGPVDAVTGSGDVRATALAAGTIALETGSGDVDLRVTAALEALRADAGSGSIELRVPAGAYALSLATDSGDVEAIGVTDEPTAAPLAARTGSGDVRVVGE